MEDDELVLRPQM